MRPLSSRGSSGLTMLYPLAANSLQPWHSTAQHAARHGSAKRHRRFQHVDTHPCKQTRLNNRQGSNTLSLQLYVSPVLLLYPQMQSKVLIHLLLGWWLSLNRRLELA